MTEHEVDFGFKFVRLLNSWSSLTMSQRLNLKDSMLDGIPSVSSYHYSRCVVLMMELEPSIAKQLFKSFIKKAQSKDFGKDKYVSEIATYALKSMFRDEISEIISSCKNERAYRMLAVLPNLNTDEQAMVLRGLSFCSNPPHYVIANKFAPTIEALKKLPTITRLKALECLVSNTSVGYDIFQNISDSDMEVCLFGSALKYRERVEKVWSSFKYFKNLNNTSVVRIEYDCNICGKYSVQITSNKIHELEDFKHTRNARSLVWRTCMFCHSSDITFNFEKIV